MDVLLTVLERAVRSETSSAGARPPRSSNSLGIHRTRASSGCACIRRNSSAVERCRISGRWSVRDDLAASYSDHPERSREIEAMMILLISMLRRVPRSVPVDEPRSCEGLSVGRGEGAGSSRAAESPLTPSPDRPRGAIRRNLTGRTCFDFLRNQPKPGRSSP
jgi:hypothetical protein